MVLLDLLLGLVADPGARAGADRAADDRARRARDGATDQRPADRATGATGARPGLVVAIGSLAGDRAARGADHAADGRADGPADRHADARARQGTGARADRLGRVLLVLRRRSIGVEIIGPADRVVAIRHLDLLRKRAVAGVRRTPPPRQPERTRAPDPTAFLRRVGAYRPRSTAPDMTTPAACAAGVSAFGAGGPGRN